MDQPLPLYESSPTHPQQPDPTPCYSPDPAPDEIRLSDSPRHVVPTGVFTKACCGVTMVLYNQEDGAKVPSYGREGAVKGGIIIEQDTSNICEVGIKLCGYLEMTTSDVGAMKITTVENSRVLWSSVSGCPDRLEFVLDLPKTFKHGGEEYSLPPSYSTHFSGLPSIAVKSTYYLETSIVKGKRLGFLPNTKRMHVPLEYRPENCPPRPISSTPYSLAAVKTLPEEWHQSSFAMNLRRPETPLRFSPVQCQAFIPSVRIYGLADTIPLHFQVSGTLASVRELVLPTADSPVPPPGDSTFNCNGKTHSPVNVFVTRLVAVHKKSTGKSTSRTQRLGGGRVWPVPPVVDFECSCIPGPPCDECVTTVVSLDWEGEIWLSNAQQKVDVGGFQAAGLSVKDFITVELVPPKPLVSPLTAMQHAIQVRFVTQSFLPESEYV